jgi:hypothetical protein
MSDQLAAQIARRFVAINGAHPMSDEDDAYVSEHYSSVTDLAAGSGLHPDEIRTLMLQRLLPLPSYLRSDGAEMVPDDLLALATTAGGPERLPDWFAGQWGNPGDVDEAWDEYLSGQLVCLRRVTPHSMKRKQQLCVAIEGQLADPRPGSTQWLVDLHELVDELDELEPAFTAYDRLRFGGPVSRDRLITAVRSRFPIPDSLRPSPRR